VTHSLSAFRLNFREKQSNIAAKLNLFFCFLCNSAHRYATSPSLFAVELMNEPLAPRATLDSLTRYYRDGYDAVRRHSPAAYVVMSNRLSGNKTELLPFAAGLQGAVIDVHYYTMFNSMFSNFTVQQNIDFVRTNFSGELAAVTTQNGPLTFVGKRGAPPDPSIFNLLLLLLLFFKREKRTKRLDSWLLVFCEIHAFCLVN